MTDNENKKIKTAMDFYMLANNLKYMPADKNQSVLDKTYGAMVLATAINSEYNKVENLGTSIRMILLGAINEHYHDELTDILKKMNNGSLYALDLYNYCSIDVFENTEGRFAFDCVTTELQLECFFEKLIDDENIQTDDIRNLYNIARNYGITERFGNDENKNFEVFRFYYLNRILRKKVRSGWNQTHWNINLDRLEKISEHCAGTVALALALASEFDFHIDLDSVIYTLSNHEIGEINIGDITPFDGITPEEKLEIEHKAIIDIIGNLSNKDNIIASLFEFDERKTDEAKFAHYCDKLEADIQSKVYQDMGCHNSLTEQENNVVFKSQRVQKMIEDGATTAFDIWYEYDKSIYESEPVFTKVLEYIKCNKLKGNRCYQNKKYIKTTVYDN